jgi:predicted PurR-regulated permease PerM
MVDIRNVNISTSTMIRGLLLIFCAYLAFKLRDILLLVLVSIIIASFVEAGVKWLSKYKVSRNLSVPIIFAITVVLIFGISYSFVPIVFRELSDMIALVSKYLPSSEPITTQSIDGATNFVDNIAKYSSVNDVLNGLKNASVILSNGATSLIGSTFGGLVNVLLVIVMAFYLSIQEKGIDTFLKVLTPAKHEKYVLDLWTRTQEKIGLWFKGQLFLAVVLGVVVFAVLALLDVKYAFLIAVISGIAELVPFGLIFAAVIAVLFAVIDSGLILGIKVLIFYVILQQVESYALSPVIAKKVVGIPPLVVLLAFLIGITLAGFLGAIVAMPLAVFVLEYLGDVEKHKLIAVENNS